MITGKQMSFEKRKMLIERYLLSHYLDRFHAKMREEDVRDFLLFQRELSDSTFTSSRLIRDLSRKRARTLDEQMTQLLT